MLLLGLCPGSRDAQAQDSGLHLRLLSSPEPGKIRALVQADAKLVGATLSRGDFSLLLNGGNSGPARDLSVRRNGDRAGLLTMVVLDDSGSYHKRAARSLARPAITEYVRLLQPTDRLGLVVFGADAKPYPIRTQGSDFLKDLDDPLREGAANRSNRQATNLLAGLGAALAQIKKEQDEQRAFPGLCEVLLFTDAGDEAAVDNRDWGEVFAAGEKHGIRVSAVVSSGQGASDAKQLSTRTRLRQLSDRTHGNYDNSDDLAAVNAQLRSAREEQKGWLVLEGMLCGLKPGGNSADARVEYAPAGARKAWTESQSFTPQWTPGSDAPCAPVVACTPACAAWQQCAAGQCAARSCVAHETCGSSARCVNGKCELAAPAPQGVAVSPWIWALALGALLLFLLAALVLAGRRARPVEEVPVVPPAPPPDLQPAPAAPSPPPMASPAPVPDVAAAAPALNPLPETHLLAIGGAIKAGEKWRLHKAKMHVGGSADPSDANDIVIPIAAVSGRHALFELFPSGDLWVTDLNARNGTYVNGQKLSANQRVKLRPGDQVKLSQQLVLQVVRPGAEAEPLPAEKDAAEPAAAASPRSSKKQTVFDPGNR